MTELANFLVELVFSNFVIFFTHVHLEITTIERQETVSPCQGCLCVRGLPWGGLQACMLCCIHVERICRPHNLRVGVWGRHATPPSHMTSHDSQDSWDATA